MKEEPVRKPPSSIISFRDPDGGKHAVLATSIIAVHCMGKGQFPMVEYRTGKQGTCLECGSIDYSDFVIRWNKALQHDKTP